jgi:CBS domain-containing protein
MEVSGTARAILVQRKDPTVWSIAPGATVFEAIELMAQKNVGALPVVDDGRLAGILSERDYTRKVILKGRSSKETAVKEIMTDPVLTVGPSAGVAECMRLMTERRVRHLPVVEQDKLVGILSIGDLLKWTISAQGVAIDNLERFITGNEPP